MTERLPREMSEAVKRSTGGDPSALLDALQLLEARATGLGWLSLWQAVRLAGTREQLRALTFAIARDTRAESLRTGELSDPAGAATLARTGYVVNSARESVRLWALGSDDTDLSTRTNLLTGLEFALDLPGGLPEVLSTSVLPLLLRSLDHDELVVRHGVLDFLLVAHERQQLHRFLHRSAAKALLELVALRLKPTLEADEVDDLSDLFTALGQEPLENTAVVAPRRLRRLALDLDDALAAHVEELGDTSELLQVVRRRFLLDDAGEEARRRGSPLNTFRVMSDAPASSLVDALLRLASTIGQLRSRTDDDDETANSHLRLVAAPAASFPIHLAFDDDTAAIAFDTLASIFSLVDEADAVRTIEQLEPSLAKAALSLLRQAAENGGKIEVILTNPSAAEWQRTLFADLSTVPPAIFDLLAQRASGRGSGNGIFVDRLMVPQANTVRLVLQAVDAMLTKGVVTFEDIDGISSHRQLNYYRQGARVLGLFDENNELTQRARSFVGLDDNQRLRLAAVYFEDSEIGRAWRQWAGVGRMIDLDADSAESFLTQCVVGLSGTTLPRRASTLRKWHAELAPYHYAAVVATS